MRIPVAPEGWPFILAPVAVACVLWALGLGVPAALLTAIAVGAAFMIVRVAARVGDRATLLAFGGILGGTLGNLVDRVVRDPGFPSGRVVDFVRVGEWPTFNLADAAITIGVAVFLVRAWRA